MLPLALREEKTMNKNKNLIMNLQRFATQTTLLEGLSDEMKTFYVKRLIDYAEPNLVHDQFGDKYPIPQNGGKTLEFRKYDSLPKATTPLVEGVTPEGNSLNVSTITATVAQYGDYIEVSDMLKMTAIDNNIVQSLKILGSQAGKTLDTITRDVLAGGTNVNYAGDKTSRSTLTSTDTLKVVDFFKAQAQLEAMNAPKIDNGYVAIIHPYAAFDLMTSDSWVSAHTYTDAGIEQLYNGEIGKLGNIRFVSSTEAKVWKDHTCPNTIAVSYASQKSYADVLIDGKAATSAQEVLDAIADGKVTAKDMEGIGTISGSVSAVFSTLVLGANAYGVTEIEGGGLETIVKQLGAGNDPLNQRATVGWKATKTAERLVEQYMLRIESLSAYSSTVAAN